MRSMMRGSIHFQLKLLDFLQGLGFASNDESADSGQTKQARNRDNHRHDSNSRR